MVTRGRSFDESHLGEEDGWYRSCTELSQSQLYRLPLFPNRRNCQTFIRGKSLPEQILRQQEPDIPVETCTPTFLPSTLIETSTQSMLRKKAF